MLDPVLVINGLGKIRYANQSCIQHFGYRLDELVDKNIKFLMPEPYQSEHDGYLANYRRTGETKILGRTREFPLLHKSGQVLEIELSVSRVQIPGQAEPLYCGSFRNITARKAAERALEESEKRFRAIFDQEYQFVGLLDPKGVLFEANQASLDAIGAKREQVIGQPFWETPWWAHSKLEQRKLQQGIKDTANGQFVRFETNYQTPTGDLRWIDFSLKPFLNEQGQVSLLLPEGRDITEIREAQQRETTMMKAFADIGESASLLVHEIKNPITAVNIALRTVAEQLGEDDQLILEELVERMKRLEGLMRRTLSLAKPLDVRLAECDITEILQAAKLLLRPHLEQQEFELDISVHPDCPLVVADPNLVDEVLTNLIRNSIEAIGSGGRIRIEASPVNDEVVIYIDDNGPGIPTSLQNTLFKPFVTTKANGSGLGLAISRKAIEAQSGTINVRKSPLGGARFEIHLPTPGVLE